MSTPSILYLKKLRSLEKSREGDADDLSSISRLPDELILQILNKLIDLKTLFSCSLVSRRFSSIVLEVDAISFNVPPLNPPLNPEAGDVAPIRPLMPYFSSESLKSGGRIELFTCVLPKSVCDKDGFSISRNGGEEEDYMNRVLSFCILKVVIAMHKMVLAFIEGQPLLEKVSVTDLGRRGRLSLSGEKLREVKEWVQTLENETVVAPDIVSYCYIPVLSLPVSGYVMKGVDVYVMEMKDDLQGEYDSVMNSYDGFEDKEEAAYTEAVMEIFKKHKGLMHTSDIEGDLPLV